MFKPATSEILEGYAAELPPGGALAGDTPRVVIISDISPFGDSGEFDDRISMIDLILFADVIDIEGIFANQTAMTQILDSYESDYDNLSTHGPYPTATSLRSKVKQFNSSNLTQLMNTLLSNGESRPLYILDWRGGFSGVTEAVTENDSTLLGKNWRYIAVSIGEYGDNPSFQNLYQATPRPWWINDNWQYRNFTSTGGLPKSYDEFSQNFVEGNGNLATLYFQQSFDYIEGNSPTVKAFHRAGDNVTFAYLLRGNPNNPSGEHWGGSYDNVTQPQHGASYGNSINSTYWTTTQDPEDENNPWNATDNPWGEEMQYDGEKAIKRYQMQFYPELAARYRRLKYAKGTDPSPIDSLQYTNSASTTEANQAPVASIQVSTSSINTNTTISLSATDSYDPDGSIVEYQWDFGDRSDYAYGLTANHQYPNIGNYTVTLRVTDNSNDSSTITRDIQVTQPSSRENQAPIASIQASTLSANTDTNIDFSGANSYDPDGSITSYHWDFGDNNYSDQRNTSHSYSAAGIYNLSLRITDNNNENAFASLTITINGAPTTTTNQAPIARFTTDTDSVTLGEKITLSAENSYDSDGTISSYNWDFGDGNFASGIESEHTYQSAATYEITLTISDDKNLSSTSKRTVSVVQKDGTGTAITEGNDGNTDKSTGGLFSFFSLLGLLLLSSYKENQAV